MTPRGAGGVAVMWLCLAAAGCGSGTSDPDAAVSAPDAEPPPDAAAVPDATPPDPDAAPPDAGVPDAVPNTPPTISAIDDQATSAAPIGPLAFTIGDAETAPELLSLKAVSTDVSVVPDDNLVLGGAGADRTLVVTPIASGTTTVTITVTDGIDSTEESFAVDVTNQPPVAAADGYAAIGNTELIVPTGEGVLANDTDGDGDALTTDAGAITTVLGGTVELAADGGFVYLPPVGTAGMTDSFDYQVTDGFETDGATAFIDLGSLVWYVDNSAAAVGDGRSIAPFESLAEAEAASGTGDIIYLFAGDGTPRFQDQGIVLANGQQLVGAGVELIVDGVSLHDAGEPPVITNTGGDGVTLAATNVVRGLIITAPAGNGIVGAGIADVRLEDLTIERAAGRAIDVERYNTAASVSLSVRNNSIRGDMAGFTTTSTGVRISFRGPGTGNLDAEIRDNDIRGARVGMYLELAGATGTGAAGRNVVVIRDNTLADLGDDGIQVEPADTAASDISIIDNSIDGFDTMGAAAPKRGIDFRVRTAAGGDTVATIEGNAVRDMAIQGISVVGSMVGCSGTLALAVTGNTMEGSLGEGLFLAPKGELALYATVAGNAMTANGNPSSFEFFAGTAHMMSLDLIGNEDEAGFQLERHEAGVLRLGGTLGVGALFDDDNGNIAANGNTTTGAAPAIVVQGSGNQIEIIDVGTIPTP